MRGSAFFSDVHDNLLRRQRNEIDSGDQIGIDIVRIFWFATARNAEGEFSIRRDVTDFFEARRFLSKSAAPKKATNPRGPIAGAFSELAD